MRGPAVNRDEDQVSAMPNSLKALGVSFRAEELYRVFLRMPASNLEEIILASAFSREECIGLIEELVAGGLIRHGSDETFSVIPPTRAIQAIVAAEQTSITERLAQLERARAALTLYASEYRPKGAQTSLAEIVPYTEFMESVLGYISDADLPVNIIYYRLKPELDERLRIIRASIVPERKYHILLPSEHVHDPSVIEPMRELLSDDVEIRFAARTVTSLTVFGREMASTMIDPLDYYSDRLVIRTEALIEIFQDYFDALWRTAIPLGHGTDVDVDEVLLLMAQGLKDEAIASQLRISLRTVRRRIAEIMETVGAESRFQAGIEAARRGLI